MLYAKYAEASGYKSVVVHSPDSDVFFILLYYAHECQLNIFFDTGSSSKRRMFNISDLAVELGEEYSESILGLYVFTGEDTNCAFKGKGKVLPLKKLQQNPRYQNMFKSLGNNLSLPESLQEKLEEFTCLLYGFPRVKSVDSVRALMMKKMVGDSEKIVASSKVDLSRLPPCHSSLVPHMKRVNYRLHLWKSAHRNIVELQSATHHGWRQGHIYLEPVWTEGQVLPATLVDLLATETSIDDVEDDLLYEEEVLSSEEESDEHITCSYCNIFQKLIISIVQ